MTRVLEITDISKHFGGVVALSGVTMCLDEGEILGIIGPNGAGKTTLFNVMSGADRPNHGRIVYLEEDITSLPMHAVAQRGLVRTFQLVSLFADKTVFENLTLGAHLLAPPRLRSELLGTPQARRGRAQVEEAAERTLRLIGLKDLREVVAGKLSSGNRKVLSVGIGLVANPRILLLDEPVAGMSQREREVMARLVRRLAHEGKSVVIVEHNVHFIMEVCSRVAVLDFGAKIADGDPEAVARDPRVIAAYLGADGE